MSLTEVLTIDEVLHLINPLGYYQWLTILQFMIHHLLSFINYGFIPYAGSTPQWACSNSSKFSQDCSVYETCPKENLTYASSFYGISTEWQLVCDRTFYVGLIASLQQASALISYPFFGYMNDRFGRKWPSVCAMGIQACLSISASYANNWQTLAALQFMIAETVTNRERYLLRSIAGVPFLMISAQTFLAYLTKHWRKYLFYGNLISVFGVALLLFMSESPRWLLQKGKMDQAIDVLRRIAKINRNEHKLPKEFVLETVKGKKSNFNLLDIFRSGYMLRWFSGFYAFSCFTFTGCSVGMWHNLGNLKSASSNIYLSKFITAPLSLASIPMALCEVKFPKSMNRRKLLICLPALIAAANLGIILLYGISMEDSWLNTGLAAIGIAANMLCMDLSSIYMVELFPTLVRGAAASFGGITSVLSGTAAPQVLSLRLYWYPAPYLIFGSLYLILTILTVLVLPNTNRMELEEIEKLVAAPLMQMDEEHFSVERKMGVWQLTVSFAMILVFQLPIQVSSGAVARKVTCARFPTLKSEHLSVLEEKKERIRKFSIPFPEAVKEGRRGKLTVAGTELGLMVGNDLSNRNRAKSMCTRVL